MTLDEAFCVLARPGVLTSHSRLVPVAQCRQALGYLRNVKTSSEEQAGVAVGTLMKNCPMQIAAFQRRDASVIRQFERLMAVAKNFPHLVVDQAVLKLGSEWPTPKAFEKCLTEMVLVLIGAAQAHLKQGEIAERREAEERAWREDRAKRTPEDRAAFVAEVLRRHGFDAR